MCSSDLRIVNELFSRARESSGGEDAVLYEYLFDLENDVDAVRSAVRDYTVVLAATCQQAVGFQMSALKGERSVFANVIVDEAARANPLDLFIPMALAERRIILVGDHRQLPHILEPDVEGQLELSVSEETRLALRRSLFQRLFESMRQREAVDGIKRTVTCRILESDGETLELVLRVPRPARRSASGSREASTAGFRAAPT